MDLAAECSLSYEEVCKWILNSKRDRKKKTNKKEVNTLNAKNKKILLKNFTYSAQPSNHRLKNLSQLTGLSVKTIKKWFRYQNRVLSKKNLI